ncbi:ribonuclease PH [Desulfitispora alkaliphila]|uniref:ribonuclease PH n=1 Tax=Desulfitispora alkaliphila TaxID=622674 RepID=UPI003D1F8676
MRCDNRERADQARPVKITTDYILHPEGSVLIEVGQTKVICSATVEERVPPFMRGQEKGWVTAEYAMLPRATHSRNIREAAKGKLSGRTYEIQRLIGRSLRAVVDLKRLGERTVIVDCDVIQADGGTRTAAITGGFMAMCLAFGKLIEEEKLEEMPVDDFLAAISIGKLEDQVLLDLCYEEDSQAEVDMNIVMTGSGKFVEVQGTAEEHPFTRDEMDQMLKYAEKGINQLILKQREVLGALADKVGKSQ